MSRTWSLNTTLSLATASSIGPILPSQSSFSASASPSLKSIIVELKGDPVVVAQAKAIAAGQSFDPEAYRQQVIAEQQQFLSRLTLTGVPYVISSVAAPNGSTTTTIPFQFNYVFNGITLDV